MNSSSGISASAVDRSLSSGDQPGRSAPHTNSDGAQELPQRELSTRRIYGYRFKIAELEGRIKVGETERTVKQRVNEQIRTAGLADLVEVVFSEPAVADDGRGFRDKEVHAALNRMPEVERLETGGGSEWFSCSVDQLRNAYATVRTGKELAPERTRQFKPRDEQSSAVEATARYIERKLAEDARGAPRFLWNAKMRFGKTFAAYQLANRIKATRVLVVTFKTAVEDAWESDLQSHVDFEGWTFQRAKDLDEVTHESVPEQTVVFVSFQNLFGKDQSTGEFKKKHQWISESAWDLVIFDEYHYGAWRYVDRDLLAGEVNGGSDEILATGSEDAAGFSARLRSAAVDEEKFLPFAKARTFLYLSGTPFRALASGEFEVDQIFNWTYVDEQRAKESWKPGSGGEVNPYAAMPKMNLLTYRLPEQLLQDAAERGRNEFDLDAFFKAKGDGKQATFKHEARVQAWLTWIQGQDRIASLDAAEVGMPFPYADSNTLPYMNHAVWFLPSVAAVHAMKNLLDRPNNKVNSWGEYRVIAVAGASAGEGIAALKPVREEIGSGYDSKTITLTCGKLLTGVTVPQWSSIFMLRNLTSPETYFQAAFRVQSAWTLRNPDGDDPNLERIEKESCLVVDFSPDRALRLYADYAVGLGQSNNPAAEIQDLVRFLPVLAFDGARTESVNVEKVLDVALASAAVDARNMEARRYINPQADLAESLSGSVKSALTAIRSGRRSAGVRGDSAIVTINQTPGLESTSKVGGQNVDDPTADSDVSIDESAAHDDETLADRLSFLAKRLNAFMYLSESKESSLVDVLSTTEVELFTEVMTLSPANMSALVEAGLFNVSALRLAILQFERSERSTLDKYTGTGGYAQENAMDLTDA